MLKKLLEKSRTNLLELGLRNNFINTRDSRLRSVRVVDESSNEIFKILVENETTMFFQSKGHDDDEIEQELGALFSINDIKEIDSDNLTDNVLQTTHPPIDLQKRLRSIEKLAKLSIEEKGANILYLALGFVRWYESDASDKARIAPLLLIPVELSRKSINSRFRVRYNNDELGYNISFFEKLKIEFGIEIEIPDQIQAGDLTSFFSEVSQKINKLKRWSVIENEIRLGLFSFSKFLMYRDLDESVWPKENKPFKHNILSKLLSENGFSEEISESDTGFQEYGDEVKYEETYHILPADSSQQNVIFSVRDKQNLVVQGPPGTGKSQTIVNIISDQVARGKKVLFVAEKLAALNVVSNKLEQLGLSDLIIELHSNKAKKKDFIQELGKTLDSIKPIYNDNIEEKLTDSENVRNHLNNYCEAVNEKFDELGFSPYQAFGFVLNFSSIIGEDIYDLDLDLVKLGSFEDYKTNLEIVSEVAVSARKLGPLNESPFIKFEPVDFTFYEAEKFIKDLEGIQSDMILWSEQFNILHDKFSLALFNCSYFGVHKLNNSLNAIYDLNNSAIEVDFMKLKEDLETLEKTLHVCNDIESFQKQTEYLNSKLLERYWEIDVDDTLIKLNKHYKKWYKFFIKEYKDAKAFMSSYFKTSDFKPSPAELVKICRLNIEKKELNARIIKETKVFFQTYTKTELIQVDQPWNHLKDSLTWFKKYYSGVQNDEFFIEGLQMVWQRENYGQFNFNLIEFGEFHERLRIILKSASFKEIEEFDKVNYLDLTNNLENCINQRSALNDYIQLVKNVKQLKSNDLEWVNEILENWSKSNIYLKEIFQYYWFKAISRKAFKDRKALELFIGENHSKLVEDYCRNEDDLVDINKFRVIRNHYDGLPRSGFNAGKIGVLYKELSKKRKLKSIRQLISDCGQMLLDIKPIFLMSPLSIAQFINTNKLEFDLVIFDEASQIKPVEAFGAILRGKQVLIVGDSKQLPPTSFFDLSLDDDDEETDELQTSDVESILALAEARQIPQKMLRWHYRSKHESLISISNREFYNSNLLVFPSAHQHLKELGFNYKCSTDTFYEPGKGGRINRGEAKLIVKEVFDHIEKNRDLSLGVVAFSQTQAKLIEDYIEQELKLNPNKAVEDYIFNSTSDEKFFVKNLENVQGDERDVIIISVGYGYQNSGRFSYSFGPINKEGGERRLNVLFSRAKRKCLVIANFRGDNIDLSRTDSYGVKVLKAYLTYAERRQLEIPSVDASEFDSIFEEQVHNKLTSAGYEVVKQVGSFGFRIDLAIKHPKDKGKFILAVECDGATYHSSKIARDRDKARQIILESMGWTFYRLWSTDWFLNPEKEFKRLVTFIDDLITNNKAHSIKKASGTENKIMRVKDEDKSAIAAEYIKYEEHVILYADLHECRLDSLINDIVKVEEPIHKETLLTRILEVTDTKKAGSRIRSHFDFSLNNINYYEDYNIKVKRNMVYINDDFSQPSITGVIRDRSNLTRREFNIEVIPYIEIHNAMLRLIHESYEIKLEEILSEIPRVFGFKKVSEDQKRIVKNHFNTLKRDLSDKISFQNGVYKLTI